RVQLLLRFELGLLLCAQTAAMMDGILKLTLGGGGGVKVESGRSKIESDASSDAESNEMESCLM
ncbi:hypothetical protein N9L68_06240, partial [bacterium]|nr:hypothetical protein [bacterium]